MLHFGVRAGLVVGIVLAGSVAIAAEVSVTTPDSDGDVGANSALVLDGAGNPVIAYEDRTSPNLMVMHCNDPDCAGGDESMTAPDPDGGGQSPAIVLDAAGNPVVAYTKQGLVATGTRVMHCNDPDCVGGDESNTAHHLSGLGHVALVLDTAGNPVVATIELESELMVMHCRDPDCAGGDESITRPTGRGGGGVSITLDASGNPVVVYGGFRLEVVHCNDPDCAGDDESITNPDPVVSGDWVEVGSIVLDAAGNPVVSYVESMGSFDPLNVLHCNDPDCAGGDESITTPTLCDGPNSLQLDSVGNPLIALDRFGEGLAVLRCDDADCAEGGDSLVIADPVADPRSLDIVLDAAGNPVISYHDLVGRDLKVAHCGDATCLPDIDDDGVADSADAFPADPAESVDTDGDGVGDDADLDDDGDGQLDVDEVECDSDPLDAASTSPDADGDGVPDCVDPDATSTTSTTSTTTIPVATTPSTPTTVASVLPPTGRTDPLPLWWALAPVFVGWALVAVARRGATR